jgi:hypothetical protein
MSSGALGKAVSNIHTNITRSLEYIVNPEKTEKQLLVSGINCYRPEDFAKTSKEFKQINDKFKKANMKTGKPIIAHHYLISFDPKDNIEPQKAHELSVEIINKFLKKEHQAVLSTHTDKKNHIHTHIIFNSYNKNNGKKYESSPEKLREFKKIINEVCLEHNLSIINKNTIKEKTVNLNYKEWMHKNNILDDKKIDRFKFIREAIKSILKDNRVESLEQLAEDLQKKYSLNVRYKNNRTGEIYKNITFQSNEWEKGIRGKYDISLETIIERLKGREIKNSKYEEYCINNDTTNYKEYIKDAIDTELKNNAAITSIEDLAKMLKEKYNIEMQYLSAKGFYLKRFKFKALDSKQKNFIGSASISKENRQNYELKAIQNNILKTQNVKFGIDIRENLKILSKNLLISGKPDRWGINTGLDYITKRNLTVSSDIDITRTKIATLKGKNELEIDEIDNYIKQMDLIYRRLQKKMIEVKSLEKEVDELTIFKMKRKKEITEKINSVKDEIEKLRESEFYQKNIKYSEKMKELNEEKDKHTQTLKQCDKETSLLYTIETIDKNKESILEQLKINQQIEQEKEEKQHENNLNKSLGINL